MEKDPTFTKLSARQAQAYAEDSGSSYPLRLYDTILDYHSQGGASLELVLDVGCGPGNATRDIASYFDRAIGIDPGEQMIAAARNKLEKERGAGNDIRFEVCAAEKCDEIESVQRGSVDLITAAMAAHWFEMPAFYRAAAKILQPGGTLALWTVSSLHCHPSTPSASKVQAMLFNLERHIFGPYELPGNRLSRDMYDKLPLPWTVDPPISDFPKANLVRYEWDRDGVLSSPDGKFFMRDLEESLTDLEKGISSSSLALRWKAAHPELAGTEEDTVRKTMKKLKEAMGGRERLRLAGSVALLLFRKS